MKAKILFWVANVLLSAIYIAGWSFAFYRLRVIGRLDWAIPSSFPLAVPYGLLLIALIGLWRQLKSTSFAGTVVFVLLCLASPVIGFLLSMPFVCAIAGECL